MFIEHSFVLDHEYARNSDARSIGSILNGLREVATLREKARRPATSTSLAAPSHPARASRLRALRGNSA
ncbi:hypothetical protein Q9Q95_07810 [Sphingomonas sp. DG1-23]|jgi:hypothetical protein|uniref:hypothetical protein n=1 Tax=Sphingomonas sp. DG1-23 TaxID=3068316 RepID=UPI00273DC8A2|nr:hypothetical protein [Sphingomonas sp. DG1-23]MDP5278825.1 hypothetical protein [Sphingomonas sp. DG1-23]